ncbi:MAG: EamA family transporter [Phyllobacteriaceae bacterium]|nr:EamA family transporter [Phyllobacteriaceae bacterium]
MLTFDIPLLRLANGEAWSVMLLRSGVTVVAALALHALLRRRDATTPPMIPGKAGLVVAALYGLTSVTFMLAVHLTTSANVAFILAFNTFFAAVFAAIFLKERPHLYTVAAMAVMVFAVLLIVEDGISAGHWLGDLLALATAFFAAAAITVSRASGKDMGFAALISAVVPAAAAAFVVGGSGFAVEQPWWLVFNGAVVMPLSFALLGNAPKWIPAPEVAMFYLLETVLAPIWIYMLFAERPSNQSLVGGLILIAALAAHSVWQLRRESG